MNISRRGFLAGLAGAALARPLDMPIGIQPYTVRNQLEKDLEGTLRQLAAIGYQSIEASVPFYGKQAPELRALLKSIGFAVPSAGFPSQSEDVWARGVEQAHTLGVEYMIITAPSPWRTSLDGWKRTADRFNKFGAMSRKAGIALAYHNHHFEYKAYDGVVAYDELLRSTDPELVKMEMDIFWTTFAGKDPLSYFEKYPGRFPMWHLKDLKKGWAPSTDKVQGNPFAEIGQGIIDWKKIFTGARQAGLRYYFVEQDQWDRPPLESARMSCEFLKNFKVS